MRRIVAFLLVLSLLAGLLTACAGPEIPGGETTAPVEQVQAEQTQPEQTKPEQTQPAGEVCRISVSEVMADNQKLCLGHTMDWIELYSSEEDTVSLDGYWLTDNPEKPEGLSLAGKSVEGGGYLVVTLDTGSPFYLSAAGGTVYLTYGGEVISQLTFPETDYGESFDQNGACAYPSPGFANSEDGYLAYMEDAALPELIISEVMSRNSKMLSGGGYYDYVELKNTSDHEINLGEYALTDTWEKPSRFYLPDVTLQSGEFYMIYCSGDPTLGENHAPFKISADGETLYVTKSGDYLDSLTVPGDLKQNESYGRSGNIPMYMKTATPGKENSDGYRHGMAVPEASLVSGLYDEAVTVELTGEGTIYYTLDGRRPTTSSKVYQKPITVTDVTTIRCFCVSEGRSSDMTAYTYVVGKEHDLPVLSVEVPAGGLHGTEGVLVNIERSIEQQGMMTLIEDGEEKFSIPIGFRLHGNDSRKGAKQNFSIRFRAEYGAASLKYPVFENRDITEFKSLLLKGGSEDFPRAMMRDELATAIPDGNTNLYVQAIKPVVLYLGGEYWGIYYIRERFSEDYVASHLGVSADSVDILESSAGYVEAGDRTEYSALYRYIRVNDMTQTEHYNYVAEHVDILSLMDWYICRSYMGDVDLANVRRFRSDEGDGKWRWMYYDLDWGWYHSTNPFTKILGMYGGDYILMQAVLESKEGKETFLNRYNYLLDTILNEEYINSTIDELVAAIESEIPRDRKRWNKSVSAWENYVQELRDFDKNGKRTKQVLSNLQSYFGLSKKEMEIYFGE